MSNQSTPKFRAPVRAPGHSTRPAPAHSTRHAPVAAPPGPPGQRSRLTPARVRLDTAPDPRGETLADELIGRLSPVGFVPARDPDAWLEAAVMLGGLSVTAAKEALAQELDAQRARRMSHGQAWRYEHVSVRVLDDAGGTLAVRSRGAVPSDQAPAERAALIASLREQAQHDAHEWALLGLE